MGKRHLFCKETGGPERNEGQLVQLGQEPRKKKITLPFFNNFTAHLFHVYFYPQSNPALLHSYIHICAVFINCSYLCAYFIYFASMIFVHLPINPTKKSFSSSMIMQHKVFVSSLAEMMATIPSPVLLKHRFLKISGSVLTR